MDERGNRTSKHSTHVSASRGNIDNITAARIFMLLSVLSMAGANIVERIVLERVDPLVAAFSEVSTAAVVFIVIACVYSLIGRRKDVSASSYHNWTSLKYFVAAGIGGQVMGTYGLLHAIQLGGISVAVPIVQTWSIWGIAFAYLFLKERPSKRTITAIPLVVLGLGIISAGQYLGIPFSDKWFLAIPYAIAASLGFALSMSLLRVGLASGFPRHTGIAVQFSAAAIVIWGINTISGKGITGIALSDYLALGLAAILAGVVAVNLLYSALARSPVSKVVLLNAAYPAFASILAWLLLGDPINALTGLGIVVIAAGCAWVQTS